MSLAMERFNRYVEAILNHEPYGTNAGEVRVAILAHESELKREQERADDIDTAFQEEYRKLDAIRQKLEVDLAAAQKRLAEFEQGERFTEQAFHNLEKAGWRLDTISPFGALHEFNKMGICTVHRTCGVLAPWVERDDGD